MSVLITGALTLDSCDNSNIQGTSLVDIPETVSHANEDMDKVIETEIGHDKPQKKHRKHSRRRRNHKRMAVAAYKNLPKPPVDSESKVKPGAQKGSKFANLPSPEIAKYDQDK